MPRYLLIAGIDFGTSFTKIVIRDKNTPSAPASVVHLPAFPDGLIPSLIGVNGDSIIPVAKATPGCAVPYLKMVAASVAENRPLRQCGIGLPHTVHRLVNPPHTERVVIRALLAAYFAHLVAGIRDFIRSHRRWRDFDFSPSGSADALVHQIAVPSGLLSQGAHAERLFREALIAACELRSSITRPFAQSVPAREWIGAVNAALAYPAAELEQKHKWQALVYPEVAAAVQTFFRSPNARDGLYITVDVGAGTVDCNAFRRRPPHGGPRKLDYYAASVAPLGVQQLKDPHSAVRPRTEVDLFADLRKQIANLFFVAGTRQPNNQYGNGRKTWDDAQLFIFGGGAHHTGYKEHFRKALLECDFHSPRVRDLPPPTDLDLPLKGGFGRFAVAYGMSFFRPDLDTIRLPHQISTFRRAYRRLEVLDWED